VSVFASEIKFHELSEHRCRPTIHPPKGNRMSVTWRGFII
jgi:hypothetical protein